MQKEVFQAACIHASSFFLSFLPCYLEKRAIFSLALSLVVSAADGRTRTDVVPPSLALRLPIIGRESVKREGEGPSHSPSQTWLLSSKIHPIRLLLLVLQGSCLPVTQ